MRQKLLRETTQQNKQNDNNSRSTHNSLFLCWFTASPRLPHSPSNTQYTERDTKAEPVTTKGNSRHDCGDNGDINNDEHGEDASLG